MSLDLWPADVYDDNKGSPPDNLDAICEAIHDATKGFGTNEKALLHAMGTQTPTVRCFVAKRYMELYNKELKQVMKSECGNKPFGLVLQYLSVPPDVAECDMIHDACDGLGTNEVLLMTVIAGRSNKEMDHLKKRYFELYTKDLGQVIASEIKRNFEALALNCLQGLEEDYDEGSVHTDTKMKEDISDLFKMGQGQVGSDAKHMFKLLCVSPPEYLKKLNLAYADEHGITVLHMFQKELKGSTEDAAEFVTGMKLKPYEEVAKLLQQASKGLGTNEKLLSASFVRYQMILKDVLLAHVELYGKTLADRVKEETGRVYESILLEVLTAVDAA